MRIAVVESFDHIGVRRTIKRWQAYAGLMCFHLLPKHLAELGQAA